MKQWIKKLTTKMTTSVGLAGRRTERAPEPQASAIASRECRSSCSQRQEISR